MIERQVAKDSKNGSRSFNARAHLGDRHHPPVPNDKPWQNGGLPSTLAGRLRNISDTNTSRRPFTFVFIAIYVKHAPKLSGGGAPLQRSRPGGLAPVSPQPTDTIFLKRRENGDGRGEKTEVDLFTHNFKI